MTAFIFRLGGTDWTARQDAAVAVGKFLLGYRS